MPSSTLRRIMAASAAVVLSLSFSIASAEARLGETQEQIETRYGKATGGMGDTQTYAFKGFTIRVHFVDGKSAQEVIQRDPIKGQLTMDEVTALLSAYGDGQKWTSPTARPKVADTRIRYTRPDGAIAEYTPGASIPVPAGPDTPAGSIVVTSVGKLVISSPAQVEWEKKNQAVDASETVKGF